MVEGEEWQTAFKSGHSFYEYTVISSGLCNPPSTLQSMIKDVFCDMLYVGAIGYMDNILINTETVEEYVALVRRVMERLRKACLCVRTKKFSFH